MSAAKEPLRIATRASALARWQADHVAALLAGAHPGLGVEIVPLSTEGDRRTDVPLSVIGGKGVFAKEVQAAVLDGRADIAVHSAKDLPALTPDGLVIAAVPERGDPRDALVGSTLSALGDGAVVATGSARRRVQLAEAVAGLGFAELRGNMATRLERAPEYSAIVVAAVALERLGLRRRITEVLDAEVMVPQVGQGALAVECRADDERAIALLGGIEHSASRRVLDCERAFLLELGGDCSLPAGAHATLDGGTLHLSAVLAPEVTDGSAVVRVERARASGEDGEVLGRRMAAELRNRVEGDGSDS
ncbi:MAG: hydroxymethylbilane synthase [Actinomycetia bacterium]|nr:hydroxymethylbilane synthase [Actinomycetes bacterium]